MAWTSFFNQHTGLETPLRLLSWRCSMTLLENRGVALVLLDLSAAFDTINTKGVVTTLQQHIGVEGRALAWFEDYLTKRKQRIRIGKFVSDSVRLKQGVPQGFVLGPVLFTAFTIPISAIYRKYNVKYHMYADDTQLYVVFDPADC